MDLLKTLITSSEKAANIARLLRQNEKLFLKLVEQKSATEANPRFQEDFKTLADVLIQEMVKHDLEEKFPHIRDRVHGEETNHFFSKQLNKEIIVEVKKCCKDTALNLMGFLDDDENLANILANEIHKKVSIEEINTKALFDQNFEIDIEQLSIWIDPIDGTNEYIQGGYEEKVDGFYPKGLRCVTVLIGAYNNQGQPVIGVVNQPFFQQGLDEGYQCHWGINFQQNGLPQRISSVDRYLDRRNHMIICVGSTEDKRVLQTLRESGCELISTRGAGYKLLTVMLGLSDAYVLSKSTTFLWDTCGPHAILLALGGNIVDFVGIKNQQENVIQYGCQENSKCNKQGIIAYKNIQVLQQLMQLPWTP